MVLGIIVGLVLLVGFVFAVGGFRYITAPFFGKVGEQIQIEGKDNRRYQYENFFRLKAAADSFKSKICLQQELLENVEDKDKKDQIIITIAGLKGQLTNTVNEYNNNAANRNDGRFLDEGLPTQLNDITYCN